MTGLHSSSIDATEGAGSVVLCRTINESALLTCEDCEKNSLIVCNLLGLHRFITASPNRIVSLISVFDCDSALLLLLFDFDAEPTAFLEPLLALLLFILLIH
jgi:hypothetical protein